MIEVQPLTLEWLRERFDELVIAHNRACDRITELETEHRHHQHDYVYIGKISGKSVHNKTSEAING